MVARVCRLLIPPGNRLIKQLLELLHGRGFDFDIAHFQAQFASRSSLKPRCDGHADGGTGNLSERKNKLSDQATARAGAVHRERYWVRDDAGVAQLLKK